MFCWNILLGVFNKSNNNFLNSELQSNNNFLNSELQSNNNFLNSELQSNNNFLNSELQSNNNFLNSEFKIIIIFVYFINDSKMSSKCLVKCVVMSHCSLIH